MPLVETDNAMLAAKDYEMFSKMPVDEQDYWMDMAGMKHAPTSHGKRTTTLFEVIAEIPGELIYAYNEVANAAEVSPPKHP